MSFLDYLKQAAKSTTSTYTKFLQQYSSSDTSVHVFLEGNDDYSFYSNFIEKYVDETRRVFYYKCLNKNSLFYTYGKINWTVYSRRRVLFFCDKDHDEYYTTSYPSDKNVFKTKFYSIENYLVNKSIFGRVFRDLLHIDDDKIINFFEKRFNAIHQEFCIDFLIITSWIIYHRRLGSSLNLNNVNLSDIFNINDDLIFSRLLKSQMLLNYLDTRTGVSTPRPFWKNILSIYRSLEKERNNKKHLRGKFEIWTLVVYSNKVVKYCNHQQIFGSKRIKIQVNFSTSNSVEVLGPRLKIPDDLKDFLDRNL